MAKFQLLVQVGSGRDFKWRLCQNPAWVSDLHRQYSYIVTPPLTGDDAYTLYNKATGKQGLVKPFLSKLPYRRLQLWLMLKRLHISHLGFPIALSRVLQEPWQLEIDQQQKLIAEIDQLLNGRLLTEQAMEVQLRKHGWWPADIKRALDYGMAVGKYNFFPGIVKYAWGISKCSRCNSLVLESRPCSICGRLECLICPTCESLGLIRACSILWTVKDHKASKPYKSIPVVDLDFSLTAAQKQASQRLVEFLSNSQPKIMVWAACGAGKTEVTFAAIKHTLQVGKQVLFAVPRRDVVKELAARIATVFSNTEIAVHYGGEPWIQNGQLVIATTHQTLRFYKRFDLVVLDEVDAYPYQGNEQLRYGVQRALKPNGKLIEMTATPRQIPSPTMLVTIPVRHHGYPLPEPKLLKVKLPRIEHIDIETFPDKLTTIISNNKAPWLIFLPTIASVKAVAAYLSDKLTDKVCCCYAADPQRDHKREQFARGFYQVMVATSIMERGITLANIQVMVLYCEHRVYDSNALIQMAGRVGRKTEYPEGDVWFVYRKMESKIKTAKKRIICLNRQAKERGLLRRSC